MHTDACIELDTNRYSVPWKLIGESVTAVVAERQVSVLCGGQEVACHAQSTLRRTTVIDLRHPAEATRQDARHIQMGMSIAKFPLVRTLEGFEHDAQRSVNPRQMRELATSRWVANGNSILLLARPGARKAHLAVALGSEVRCSAWHWLFSSTQMTSALSGCCTRPG